MPVKISRWLNPVFNLKGMKWNWVKEMSRLNPLIIKNQRFWWCPLLNLFFSLEACVFKIREMFRSNLLGRSEKNLLFPWKRAKCSATWWKTAHTQALRGNRVLIVALSSQTSTAVMSGAGGSHRGGVSAGLVPAECIGFIVGTTIQICPSKNSSSPGLTLQHDLSLPFLSQALLFSLFLS